MKIKEIFQTLQGEGSLTGTAATFVRFSKCNLSCDFCDTEFEQFTEMTVEQVVEKVLDLPAMWVVITGGEPTIQLPALYELVDALHERDHSVALESNGTNAIDIERFDHVTISPKDKAVMAKKAQEGNQQKIKQFFCHDLKIVDFADNLQNLDYYYRKFTASRGYYLQPLSNQRESIERCAKFIIGQYKWKLSLQTHKIVGLP